MTPDQYRREGFQAGIEAAMEACRNTIKNYDVMEPGKPDHYASRKTQYAAKSMVRQAIQEISAIDVDEVLAGLQPRCAECDDGILPCPFCGSPAEITEIDEGENAGGSCVCCTKCLASGNVEFGFKENFVSIWNRRVQAPAPAPDAVARLVETAIAEYLLEPPFQTELERMGRKATARGMMVRLGIYEKFKEALAAMETSHD